jgi:hypothetical protein
MTAADLLRKAIVETEASLAAQRAALAEIEAGPNAAQSPHGAQSAHSPQAGSLIRPHLKSVKQAAAMLGMTEKRLRRIAPALDAEVRLGGRVLVNQAIIEKHLAGKNWANSSTDEPAQISDALI